MEKIVKNGLRDCTVNLDGSECEVRFDTCFRAFAVRNDSTADVFVSKEPGIVPDGDGVMCVRPGASAVFAHNDLDKNTVYLLGTGKVLVHGQQDSNNPFNFAPTFDGGVQASGNPVVMDGLQGGVPFSEMFVTGKNLIKYPYASVTKTENGITFTDNGDGTIIIDGTATADAKYYLSLPIILPKGNYTIGFDGQDEYCYCHVYLYDAPYTTIATSNTKPDFVITENTKLTIRIVVKSGKSFSNFLVRPQLELGTTPTAYEPPITGRDLTVGVSGKNLLRPNCETKSLNGINFTVNADKSIMLNGTSTAGTAYAIGSAKLTQGKKYRMSMAESPNGFNMHIGSDIRNQYDYTTTSKTIIAQSDDNVVWLWVQNGITIDNVTIYPQIEIGDIATVYEPYHGSVTTITPDTNPYVIPNDIRQVDGYNVVSVSAGELSVSGVQKNAAIKRIWDEIDEIKTAIIVSNGESE